MDDARIGRICRALRRRRGWRQIDLANRAGCHQTTVSRIERGQVARLQVALLRDVFKALDASFDGVVGWRGGDLDRLLDEKHARIVEAVAGVLIAGGWEAIPEASYSEWGERGSIDLLAAHVASRAAAVIEIKSDLTSVEETIRKLDQKARLVATVLARKRFGWQPRVTGRVLVVPEDPRIRRLVTAHSVTFASAYPMRSRDLRRWLAAPREEAAGLWFLTLKPAGIGSRKRGGPKRVRRPAASSSERDLPADPARQGPP